MSADAHDARDFLVELGTEELPPKALHQLMTAFAGNLEAKLDGARLTHGAVNSFATPRRLAVLVTELAATQSELATEMKGPPVSVAFDADGKPTAAARAFADKCGTTVAALRRRQTDKGEWLAFDVVEKGRAAVDVLAALVESALADLPIPRRMRWGAGNVEFARPVHWLVMLYGPDIVAGEMLGVRAGRQTQGHRFHSNGPVTIDHPGEYLARLEKAFVVADFDSRRERVRAGVEREATRMSGYVVDADFLYDEVTALVEWPVALAGAFDEHYLQLPREILVSTLTGHQRYFPIAGNGSNDLLPFVVRVASMESREPQRVREGNERVVRPRLADAAFFGDNDRKLSLASRESALHQVVYQQGLGSLLDKSRRIARLAGAIATAIDIDPANSLRAAALCKCDLLTGVVGEFPDLQGTIGRYYALHDGEPAAVADAIGEQYMPRFAGDSLPQSTDGEILALADKLDTLAGAFSLGKKPTGNRDPFGLRRAALGVVRILIERRLDLDLPALIRVAVDAQPATGAIPKSNPSSTVVAELFGFINDRLRRYFLDRDDRLLATTFDAVLARQTDSLLDFEQRLMAVHAFLGHEAAQRLAAANKRIGNILRQSEGTETRQSVQKALLTQPAEKALFAALDSMRDSVADKVRHRHYIEALVQLAALRGPVDRFFDEVMVMDDNDLLRRNRLALLADLQDAFLDIADIARLTVA